VPPPAQSPLVFESGGKLIRLDAYLPETLDGPVPTVIALHGAGGNVSGMERYASVLAAEGFAVYLLHYFDRTGAESADLQSMKRNFPLWVKTLWEPTSRSPTPPSTPA
jgi:dienelactone hydrolase